MNELMDKYSSKGLSILGFPCNQFGHQENCNGNEIMTALKYIRPGNGFIPKIQMMSKVEVYIIDLSINCYNLTGSSC